MFATDSATPSQPKLALAADAHPLCADQEPNSLKEIQLTDNEKISANTTLIVLL
ncbi:hypothetical protein [Massilia sp. CCM 8734]|uniref:hypothetical protein n=1 Tax=Massilia sp. CCM 8734 TaxID=2609283 RepID=UPI001422C1E8|nr:hypothetical protein [Massilia sp. CCM 8734]